MTYYHPCKNCAVSAQACPRRLQIKSAISGLSVTSLKFKCEIRQPRFEAGQRVSFKWKVYETTQIAQDDFETESFEVWFRGTVAWEKSNRLRFVVRVDADQDSNGIYPTDVFKNDNLIVSVRPDDMRAINECSKSMCPNCLAYDKAEASSRCQSWDCGAWDAHHPDGCLLGGDEIKKF